MRPTPAKTSKEVREYIHCPGCEYRTRVDHLTHHDQFYTKWTCEECKTSYHVEIRKGTPFVEIDDDDTECISGYSVLKMGDHILLVDDDLFIRPEDSKDLRDHEETKRFYYEENSSPINALQDTEEILDSKTGRRPFQCFEYLGFVQKDDPNMDIQDDQRSIEAALRLNKEK